MYGSANVSFEALKELYFGYRNTVVTKTPWPIALDWMSTQLHNSTCGTDCIKAEIA
jgi:hypothetical protein